MPLTPVYIAVLVFELSFDHWPVGHRECGLSVRQLQTYITYLAAPSYPVSGQQLHTLASSRKDKHCIAQWEERGGHV